MFEKVKSGMEIPTRTLKSHSTMMYTQRNLQSHKSIQRQVTSVTYVIRSTPLERQSFAYPVILP